MSLYNGPARGGNRGGKDQFNWESVKSDKDREFYLGHSVRATTGRWQKGWPTFRCTCNRKRDTASATTTAGPKCLCCQQKDHFARKYRNVTALLTTAGKDVFWYTREKQEEEAAKARLEMQAIKQREEDLMNEVGEQQPAAKVYGQTMSFISYLCRRSVSSQRH